MSGLAGLSAPSYMPTLFRPVSSDASLLAALSGNRAEETATASPSARPEQARTDETKPVAPGAARPDDDSGNANAPLDLTTTATRWPGLIV
jgi:hypothetical protein